MSRVAIQVAMATLLCGTASLAARADPDSGLIREPDATLSQDEGERGADLERELNEEVVRIPIKVRQADGTLAERTMVATVFKPAGDGPFPVVIFNHGRNPATRSTFGRMRALPMAGFLVRRKFAVLVPTRLGYGDSGYDIDPEQKRGGSCDTSDYSPLVEAHAAQVKAALGWLKGRSWADAERVVLAGVSAGGLGSVTSAAREMPGIVGVINFAGGIGGSFELDRKFKPCNPANVGEKFAAAGGATPVESLWLYAANDRLWGPKWPQSWLKSYTKAGGKAEFHMLPALGDDGHNIIGPGFRHWRPFVDAFLNRLGFDTPKSKGAPAASGFARIDDPNKVPLVKVAVRSEAYERFLARDLPRAFVIAPNGGWVYQAGAEDALEKALQRCRTEAKSDCKPYAVDDSVVWTP